MWKSWKICFFLPLELLEEIGGPIPQIAGTKIACNFYKVCEGGNAEQIHYASYSPVDVPDRIFIGRNFLKPENCNKSAWKNSKFRLKK